MVTIGLLGVLTGFRPIRAINRVVTRSVMLALAYACYTAAITVWSIPFPLLVIGVVLTLMVIYRIGTAIGSRSLVSSEVILLGKYSLLGYIAQIAILQILSVIFRRGFPGVAWLLIPFVAAFILTIATVEMMDRARARVSGVDRLYRSIFA
jgi:peptidoglycan/LPS O-acetylase OafA/YrhL